MKNLLVAETHPQIQQKQGLSMADALDKLNTDKLNDIDPRPQQLLSNDIIPPRFHAFADVKTAYVVGRDTPFFWHIPRSGGVVVKTMLSHCLNQTLAAEVGEMDGHQNDSVSVKRDDQMITWKSGQRIGTFGRHCTSLFDLSAVGNYCAILYCRIRIHQQGAKRCLIQ